MSNIDLIHIGIFENQFEEIRGAFDICNKFYFGGRLKYEYFASSDAIAIEDLIRFKLILIDLDLSPKGSLDGYALAKKINDTYPTLPKAIITSSSSVKEKLEENQIAGIQVLQKPFDFEELNSFLKKLGIK